MDWKSVLVSSVLLVFIARVQAEPSFCSRGFQIAGKYHFCWERAEGKIEPYTGFNDVTMLTPALVEDYATFMCRKVKPISMECLAEELTACDDQENLLKIADKSGGACMGSDLNPFFKTAIIDHLKPIRMDSKCFNIGEDSYNCYTEAGQKIIESGDSLVTIDKFSSVANKFFNYIWTCHINLFKKMDQDCDDNWQIPMLLALQKTAMPSLFGMHLSNSQVEQLELSEGDTDGEEHPDTHEGGGPEEPEVEETAKIYLLIREINDATEAEPGDIVVELPDAYDDGHLSISRAPFFNREAYNMISSVLNKHGQLDLAKLRRKLQAERRNKKEMKDYLNRLRMGDRKRSKDKKKRNQRPRA